VIGGCAWSVRTRGMALRKRLDMDINTVVGAVGWKRARCMDMAREESRRGGSVGLAGYDPWGGWAV
jgi:hypothetical protein